MYRSLVAPLVLHCLQGGEASLVAFGPPAGGKSYTMGTDRLTSKLGVRRHRDVEDSETDLGALPRAVQAIFESLELQRIGSWTVTICFAEVLNGDVYDCCSPDDLPLPQTMSAKQVLSDARSVRVRSAIEMFAVLGNAAHRRERAWHAYGDPAVNWFISIVVERTLQNRHMSGRLTFVDLGTPGDDLAGFFPEASSEYDAQPSLLALGNLLLSSNRPGVFGAGALQTLTEFLEVVVQRGEETKTKLVMLACVTPYHDEMPETQLTLRYVQSRSHEQSVVAQIIA